MTREDNSGLGNQPPDLRLITNPVPPLAYELFDGRKSLDLIPDLSVSETRGRWLERAQARAELNLFWNVDDDEDDPLHPAFTALLEARLANRKPEIDSSIPRVLIITYNTLPDDDDESDGLLHLGFGLTACFNLPDNSLIKASISKQDTKQALLQFGSWGSVEQGTYRARFEEQRLYLGKLLANHATAGMKISEEDVDDLSFSVEQCLYLIRQRTKLDKDTAAGIRGTAALAMLAMNLPEGTYGEVELAEISEYITAIERRLHDARI